MTEEYNSIRASGIDEVYSETANAVDLIYKVLGELQSKPIKGILLGVVVAGDDESSDYIELHSAGDVVACSYIVGTATMKLMEAEMEALKDEYLEDEDET